MFHFFFLSLLVQLTASFVARLVSGRIQVASNTAIQIVLVAMSVPNISILLKGSRTIVNERNYSYDVERA